MLGWIFGKEDKGHVVQLISKLELSAGGFVSEEAVDAKEKLVALGDKSVAPLLEYLQNNEPKKGLARGFAIEVLGKIGNRKKTIKIISAIAGDLSDEDNIYAVQALGNLRCKSSLPQLITILQESEPGSSLRFTAIEIIGEFKDRSTINVIIPYLDDADDLTRNSAVKVLGQFKPVQLLEKMKQMAEHDPDILVRSHAQDVVEELAG